MRPQVISKGTDLIAMKIRDLAKAHSVPVLQSPMLARALYAHADLDQPIPATLYTAVAQVLAYVYRLKAALRGEGRMPDALPDPMSRLNSIRCRKPHAKAHSHEHFHEISPAVGWSQCSSGARLVGPLLVVAIWP